MLDADGSGALHFKEFKAACRTCRAENFVEWNLKLGIMVEFGGEVKLTIACFVSVIDKALHSTTCNLGHISGAFGSLLRLQELRLSR